MYLILIIYSWLSFLLSLLSHFFNHGSSPIMRRFRPSTSNRRKPLLVVTLLLLILLLVRSLPELRQSLHFHAHSHVDDRPRFLYRSTFRENPDSIYEQKLSEALRDIERQQVTLHGPSGPAEEIIWQIILGKEPGAEQRGADSLQFEEKNPEWKYKVSIFESLSILAIGYKY